MYIVILYNFSNTEDGRLGLSYPPNDSGWADEILNYDKEDTSPSIMDEKRVTVCEYCQAHLLPHEHDGLCCNHGQVTN